jgi:microcystin-dependent protein
LKRRVLVGHNSYNQDYSSIGNTGGLSHVRLKTGELPAHTHTDSAHSHYVSLTTSNGGEHAHNYKDTFWSEDHRSYYDDYHYVNGIGTLT